MIDAAVRHDFVATTLMLGGAQIGGLYRQVDDDTAAAALQAAWDRGVRRFDTAPHYGAGLSERRLGIFLQQFPRDSFTLCTKVGRLLVDTECDTDGDAGFFGGCRKRRALDYSGDGVRRSLAESLERLGLDRIDIALIHDPEDHLDQAIDGAYPALHDLRTQGVVSSIGAGMNFSAPLTRIVRETEVDTVMIAGRYTLLDQSAALDLFPACTDRGVSVIAAGVFNTGLLADPKPGATYDYSAAPPHLVTRARAIKHICDTNRVALRAAAIQFPLQCPAVATVCVGARDTSQVCDSVDMLLTPVPPGLWHDLHAAMTT